MTQRTPLRPLARILDARQRGENPDLIERENLRLRHEAERDRLRQRTEGRMLLVAVVFLFAFGSVGARMAALATSEAAEPAVAQITSMIHTPPAPISSTAKAACWRRILPPTRFMPIPMRSSMRARLPMVWRRSSPKWMPTHCMRASIPIAAFCGCVAT